MSHEKLKEALVNWQAQKAYYEKELSITSHAPTKFELEKQIQICDKQITKLRENLVASQMKEVTHKKGCLFLAINVVIMGVAVSITVFNITISHNLPRPNPNPTQSATNIISPETPRDNPEQIGELEGYKIFQHSISDNLPEQTYHFKLANTSDVSLYLDGVSSETQMFLHKANEAGVITSYMTMKSASNAKSGVIKEKLETGDYVVVVKLISRPTKYFLRLFNNTNLAENVDYLDETEKKYTNQTISSQYPEKYYHFKLANPTNVSLRLEGVNSDTQILLNKADEAGVIRSYITMSSASKAKSGVIQEKLETGDYVVVIRFQTRDTKYNLTMSAQ